jgi:penicillin-binding protein 2
VSCDVFFYKTVRQLNLRDLNKVFNEFGFGQKTKIDIPNETVGLVPDSDYMRKRYGKYGWSRGVLLNLAIGQGELLVTPMQILNYVNLLSTKGKSPNCHFVFVDNLPKNDMPILSNNIWDNVHKGLRAAITDENGTGKKADPNLEGFKLYGKTGTAENPHGDNHAWFVGWADFYDKKYSIVVLLENAGSGGAVAAPLVKDVFEKMISKEGFVLK